MPTHDAHWFRDTYTSIRAEIGKSIVGQDAIVEGVLVGMVSDAHILLEGMPGLGKTLLVRALSQVLDLRFSRIQFTPDMMPADVTGTNVLSADGSRRNEFRHGPIFANIVLADEINRATPKTQSAMLEAMQERSVTVGGVRHQLESPFLVMATQNPIEQEGTYPLPEAQLDRFLLKLLVPFPSKEELAVIVKRTTGLGESDLTKVADADAVVSMRRLVREVPIADAVLDFALNLVVATHPGESGAPPDTERYVRYGSSPRGAQALVTTAKAFALIDGRYNVAKEDLIKAAKPALRHRIGLNFEAEADAITADCLIDSILSATQAKDRDPISV